MKELTYDDLKQTIADDEYKNYRIVLKSSGKEYSFRAFINDLDALYGHRYPVNSILQHLKNTAKTTEGEIVIQKMVLKPATDLGLGELEGFGYQDFEDYAVFSFKNEMQMLADISSAVESFVNKAAECFGKNDPVF